MMSHAPVFIVITPIFGALLLGLLHPFIKKELYRDIIALLSLMIPLILMLLLYRTRHHMVYEMGGWPRPYGIVIVIDGLSALMVLISGIVTVTTFLYSLEEKRLLPVGSRYNFLFLFMAAGLYGVFLAGDIVNRYVFFELTIISTYVLLTYKGTKESLRASYNFLIIGSTASFFFLAGIGLLYFNTGFLDFGALKSTVPYIDPGTRNIIFSFFIIAIGMKMGLIPFHTWFSDAHVNAPTPMTAILAALTIKTGLYIMIKLFSIGFDTLPIRWILVFLGAITALAGVMMTLKYTDLKRILAWFTMSQMGMIVVSIALWSPLGIAGGVMHMVNHSLFISLLFLSCGALAYVHGTQDIRRLPILKSNILLSVSFIIGTLAILGIPPLNGYYGGSMILQASSRYPPVYIVLVLTYLLTAISFVRILALSSGVSDGRSPPESMLIPLVVLAGLCVFLGVLSPLWMRNAVFPAVRAIRPGTVFAGSYGYLNIHGLVLVVTSAIGAFIGYFFASSVSSLKLGWADGLLSRVPVTDAIRYMIIVMALVLVLFTIF